MIPIKSSEITPEAVFKQRRQLMKGVGALALGAVALAACGAPADELPAAQEAGATQAAPAAEAAPSDVLNSFEEIINYNNFYEFTTDKQRVAELAQGFVTDPWSVTIGGMVNKPKTFAIEDILSGFEQEERIYRLRCVEGWSMVIPWLGFPLRKLLEQVEPTAEAKYVRFETLFDPDRLPGQRSPVYEWPYVEGLRLDEAMNDLTLLSTGLYGKTLLPQSGAPLRLVVPWKYGFKSIKSIVKIDLVADQPSSLWMIAAPHEYGFYANVNPDVLHPRWSQRTERRIGERKRRETLLFNGYADEVAGLYADMDLRKFF